MLGYVGRVHGITTFIDMVQAKKNKSEEVVEKIIQSSAVGGSEQMFERINHNLRTGNFELHFAKELYNLNSWRNKFCEEMLTDWNRINRCVVSFADDSIRLPGVLARKKERNSQNCCC